MKIHHLETEKSVGRIICHDITKIEKGAFKGALFKKGHRIRREDVETLLCLGKKHIYALELEPGDLHEDDAGERIARALAGPGVEIIGPSEGRLDLAAAHRGLLKIDLHRLQRINCVPDVVVATLHSGIPVEAGERVAGAKVIPLIVSEETVGAVERICAEGPPPFSVLPYLPFKMGGVITGREVVEGRIKDGFAPVLAQKAATFAMDRPLIRFAGDDADLIAASIEELLQEGCNLVIITGGMSVDPDDVTPSGIRKTGAHIVKYGAPALPGAMFLLAYKDDIPLIGLPACAMYFQNTVLDILLPRLLAGERVTAAEIAALGHGGLCRRCDTCFFPKCSFGKGGF
ncbi:MAG: molybdopterin-binding protein [Bacillota bacterium]